MSKSKTINAVCGVSNGGSRDRLCIENLIRLAVAEEFVRVEDMSDEDRISMFGDIDISCDGVKQHLKTVAADFISNEIRLDEIKEIPNEIKLRIKNIIPASVDTNWTKQYRRSLRKIAKAANAAPIQVTHSAVEDNTPDECQDYTHLSGIDQLRGLKIMKSDTPSGMSYIEKKAARVKVVPKRPRDFPAVDHEAIRAAMAEMDVNIPLEDDEPAMVKTPPRPNAYAIRCAMMLKQHREAQQNA